MQCLLTVRATACGLLAIWCVMPAIGMADQFVCGWPGNDAVVLLYNPGTGHLGLSAGGGEKNPQELSITTLEIFSKSGVFTGEKPFVVSPPFDIYRSNKLFILVTAGTSYVDFGAAMAPGLTANFLLSDLSIDGSYLRGGSLRSGGGGGPYLGFLGCPVSGDFNNNQRLDHSDLDALAMGIQGDPLLFDLDGDADADLDDWIYWVRELKYTWIGDTDLNGRFDSGDLVSVFSAGTYEDGLPLNSTWLTGDWNADFEFDTGDLVFAFQDGGYERGTRDVFPARPDERTWFGDADLNGEFDGQDFVAVFRAGKYEDSIPPNSDWASGDWDGDGDFDTSDFVLAFKDGGFGAGPRTVVPAVPEPSGLVLLVIGLCGRGIRRRAGR